MSGYKSGRFWVNGLLDGPVPLWHTPPGSP
jgi:hypothetical protein